ncbi:putative Dopamine beta-hydroxylase precursor [Planoprotostelium fungivorum]|uniref:Putative Dopamine beta-hydroxylase n=1 Tax=Planoprotostelium fungivorum TaxID=1890364 RepID=A0A2P6NQ51_9EUKA|nr:putative Dopamine beta-hydroxylase precursor [Planoprotostelium fungivorum]
MRYLWQISAFIGLGLLITSTVLVAISTVILQTSKQEAAELIGFDMDLGFDGFFVGPESNFFQCRELQSNFTNQAELHAIQFQGFPNTSPYSEGVVAQIALRHCDYPVGKRSYFSCDDVPRGCQQILYSWSPGTDPLVMPSVVGVPFGPKGYNNLLLRIHYINPSEVTYIDNSRITVSLTPELRPYTAGYLLLGPSSKLILDHSKTNIPPGQNNFTIGGDCPPQTISSIIDGIPGKSSFKVITSTPVGHGILTNLTSILKRNGQTYELSSNGTFVYGQTSTIPLNVNVYSGDEIVTECTFNSTSRTKTTPGGYDNQSELCFNYLLYYPAANAIRCEGNLPITLLASAS